MTDELGDQYKTDENLRRRQGLFDFAVPPPTPQPDLTSTFTWEPQATVLDVGCGNGLWSQIAQGVTPDAMIVGIDSSAGMAGIFRERVGVSSVVGDITRLPVRSESADAVLALWMLYHVPDKAAALGEVARVLRPDGFLVAATNSASEELFSDLYGRAIERVLGQAVTAWGPVIDFTVENGAEILSSHFQKVDSWVIDTWFEVDRADPFVAVAASLKEAILMVHPGLAYDDFLAQVETVAAEQLRRAPIRFARRSGFFKASRPV